MRCVCWDVYVAYEQIQTLDTIHLFFNTQYMSNTTRQCKQWTNLVLKCKLDVIEIQSDRRVCVRSGLFYWSVDSHQLIGSVLPPYSRNCLLIKQQLTLIRKMSWQLKECSLYLYGVILILWGWWVLRSCWSYK